MYFINQIIKYSPEIENVDSCIFLWPSGLAPLHEGVLTEESGKVGVAQM